MEQFNAEKIDRLPTATELGYIAGAMTRLHRMEHYSPLAPGANKGRAYKFLSEMLLSGRGAAPAIYCGDGSLLGCVIMQFDAIPYHNAALVGGLYVVPEAPRHTVLMLMQMVIEEADRRGVKMLYLMANTNKNKSRRAYYRLGFRNTGLKDADSHLFSASIEAARHGLAQMQKGKLSWVPST